MRPSDQPYRALYAYIWDVGEVEPDSFAADMQRHGLNTLTLASCYHAGKFMRPHGVKGRVAFSADGRASCRLRRERYGTLKPEESPEVAADDIFGRFAGRQDLAINAWTVLLHNDYLGNHHPDAVVQNVFGDHYWYSLCPANPDVRFYAVTLCADIADRYAIASLTLETPGWLPYRHGYHHEISQLGANPALDLNLGLCFCRYCMSGAKRAGIDIVRVRERVSSWLSATFAASYDAPLQVAKGWMEADLLLDAEFAAFLRWRSTIVTSLVAEIRASTHKDVGVVVLPSVQQPTALCWIEGSDLAAVSKVCDGLEICLYGGLWQAAVADATEVRHRVGPDVLLRGVLRPAPPDYPEEGGFAATVKALCDAGFAHLGFYNYGHMRLSQMEWIGRALSARQPGTNA